MSNIEKPLGSWHIPAGLWMALPLAIGISACDSPGPQTSSLSVTIDANTTSLPTPVARQVAAPVLSARQQARAAEVERALIARYRGYRILATTQTYVGDIVDWIDPATVPGSDAVPPPPVKVTFPDGVEPMLTEIEAYPELRGPEGSIAMIRPTFTAYVRGDTAAVDLDDFITRYQVLGQPAGQFRLYGGYSQAVANRGGVGTYNAWATGSIEARSFSLLELNSFCLGSNPATDLEFVGIVMSRDQANFGNSTLRLQVEFATAGGSTGNNIGGWNGLVSGFVAAAGAYAPGFALTPLSTAGGTQYDRRFELQLFNGNWWINDQGTWIGYYPGTLFNLINTSACLISWYGEVFDPSPTDWTANDMGSGQFASGAFGQSGYIRLPFYIDSSGVSQWPAAGLTAPRDTACYTTSNMLTDVSADWTRYFYLGGPGGDATGCN
jgi:hypothetical protein